MSLIPNALASDPNTPALLPQRKRTTKDPNSRRRHESRRGRGRRGGGPTALRFDAACALRGRACSVQGGLVEYCACTSFAGAFLLPTRVRTPGAPHITSLRPTRTTITTAPPLEQGWEGARRREGEGSHAI